MKLFDAHVTRRDDGAILVEVTGDLDLSTLAQFESALDGRLDGKPELVVLDLRELTFLDSSGLRAMLGLHESQTSQGGRLVIVRGPRRVHRVLELTRADEELEIVADPAAIDPRRDVSTEAG